MSGRGIVRNAQGRVIAFTPEFYSDIVDEEVNPLLEDPVEPVEVKSDVVRVKGSRLRVKIKVQEPEDPGSV